MLHRRERREGPGEFWKGEGGGGIWSCLTGGGERERRIAVSCLLRGRERANLLSCRGEKIGEMATRGRKKRKGKEERITIISLCGGEEEGKEETFHPGAREKG